MRLEARICKMCHMTEALTTCDGAYTSQSSTRPLVCWIRLSEDLCCYGTKQEILYIEQNLPLGLIAQLVEHWS